MLLNFKRLGIGQVLRGALTQLHQTWREHRVIMTTQEACFKVWTSCCIFKHGGQSWVMLKMMPNFTLFDLLWKFGEEWARSLYQLLKLYLRPNLRGCWAWWLIKKNRKKSSWVKLKVFPNLLAGRPNNSSYSTKIARQFTVNGARNATSFSKVITERLLKTATSVHSSVNQL